MLIVLGAHPAHPFSRKRQIETIYVCAHNTGILPYDWMFVGRRGEWRYFVLWIGFDDMEEAEEVRDKFADMRINHINVQIMPAEEELQRLAQMHEQYEREGYDPGMKNGNVVPFRRAMRSGS
jgi:hypothetical protein